MSMSVRLQIALALLQLFGAWKTLGAIWDVLTLDPHGNVVEGIAMEMLERSSPQEGVEASSSAGAAAAYPHLGTAMP